MFFGRAEVFKLADLHLHPSGPGGEELRRGKRGPTLVSFRAPGTDRATRAAFKQQPPLLDLIIAPIGLRRSLRAP
jgi:hypothetical protein